MSVIGILAIDLLGPGIDTPGQVDHVREAIVFQKARDMKTSHAMMANHHRFPLRIQLG
jgi:hypothetical protein